LYLLDTNHCSRLFQGHPAIVKKLQSLGNAPVATCVIVRGELVFMAAKSQRSIDNLQKVKQFLDDIIVYSIDDEVADIYGRLKAAVLDKFGPKEKAKRRKTKTEKLGFAENDLWIAAIAKRHGLTVVSADSDFERIRQADNIQLETWWSPEPDHPRT
jgi:Predicted nucleic acid-binding protein, contains PIN domain